MLEKIALQKSVVNLLSVADSITVINAVLGFLAIISAASGQVDLAVIFIFFGLLADGADGMVARRLGHSQIGEYLEAIADMISLSVAPLVLLYMTYQSVVVPHLWVQSLFLGTLAFSFLCSVIRLSSFSLMKHPSVFVGLPTSVSALGLVLFSLFRVEFWVLLPCVVLLALAMISPLRYPKLGLKLNILTAVFILATLLINGWYHNVMPVLFLLALLCYIFVGPLYLSRQKPEKTPE